MDAEHVKAEGTLYSLELFPTEGNWDSYAEWLKEMGGGFSTKPNADGELVYVRPNDNAGVDLYCVRTQEVPSSGKAELLDLGVKARMYKIWESYENGNIEYHKEPCHFWLAPRSSIWKSNVRQANSIGVIDRSYRGVLMGAVLRNEAVPTKIEAGTRLFQILAPDMGYINVVRLKPLSKLDSTVRGDGGFGSTGR
jgi:hypothetical protein